jgi:Uma2 family endonuclease
MSNIGIPVEWLPQYTTADYQKWEGDWELIKGLPYAMSPSPMRKHQLIGGQFVTLVNNALANANQDCACEVLYEMDWIINDTTIVRPDVMIVCNTPPSDFVQVPPVLILEIFSAATRLKDRNVKFRIYEENGVPYYLMADPETQRLEIFELKDNRYREVETSTFKITVGCRIALDLQKIWP